LFSLLLDLLQQDLVLRRRNMKVVKGGVNGFCGDA
jgi:hypothetical protein